MAVSFRQIPACEIIAADIFHLWEFTAAAVVIKASKEH
jgi:hypothetical protein